MTIVIIGKSGSGKTTLAKYLEEIKGFRRIITYTTRPIRENEVDGVDYHFLSQEEFNKRKEDGFFAETADYDASFGHCSYGSAKEDYNIDNNSVIVLNPYGVKQIYGKTKGKIIYIIASNDLIRKRLQLRGDKSEEIERRLETDEIDFKDMDKYSDFNIKIDSNSTIEDIAHKIQFALNIDDCLVHK